MCYRAATSFGSGLEPARLARRAPPSFHCSCSSAAKAIAYWTELRDNEIAAINAGHGGEVKKCQNVLPVRHSCPAAIVDGFELESCNPHLAHRALQAEPELGLLLPCNVIVYTDADGTNRVSIVDPKQMLGVVQNEELTAIADESEARLRRVVDKLSG